MKRILTPVIAIACLGAAALVSKLAQSPPAVGAVVATVPDTQHILFASQGRIEGGADLVEVSASMDGVIETVLVAEGQTVRKGQLVARLACPDREASAASQLASVEAAKQALARLRRGSREEERRAAAEATAGSRTVRDHANAQFERFSRLYETEDISREAFENSRKDLDVAEANLRRDEQLERLTLAPPLAEDVARLEAEVSAAEARARESEALVRKCDVASPVNGTVIDVLRKAGESVSILTPQPIIRIGDLSVQRVRAEVDERDVINVFVGQSAVVRVDGAADQVGRVSRLALRMGRKSVQAIAPGDKNDRDVLDVWIALPSNRQRLPLGLRVLVQFSRLHWTIRANPAGF